MANNIEMVRQSDFIDYKGELRDKFNRIEQNLADISSSLNELTQEQTKLECSVNQMNTIVNSTCDSLTTFQDNLSKLNANIGNLDFERLKNRDKEAKKDKVIFGIFTAGVAVIVPGIIRVIGAFLAAN